MISLLDYFQSSNDTVSVDTIRYVYEDQVNFDPDPRTNFDAEALISFDDSLYLFTKNRGDFHTNIYSIPKTPGDYQAHRVGRINAAGLITGAVHNSLSQEIMLTGYTLTEPFLMRLSEFTGQDFTSGQIDQWPFQVQGSFQIETIEAINETDYYLTSETNALGDASLMLMITDFVVGTSDSFTPEIKYFPNPVSRLLKVGGIKNPGAVSISLFDAFGKRIYHHSSVTRTQDETINFDLTVVLAGLYLMKLNLPGREISRKLMVTKGEF